MSFSTIDKVSDKASEASWAGRLRGGKVGLLTAFLLYAGIANPYAGFASEWAGSPPIEVPPSAAVDRRNIAEPRPIGHLPPWLHRKLDTAFGLAVDHLLVHPECRGLFEQLDGSGLDALALGRFDLAPGRLEQRVCRSGIAAFTRVGGQVTYLCRNFARLAPAQAAKVVIHEALHQAGLPESPADPKALRSNEINELVARSCEL